MTIGVDVLPPIPKDSTDRNRTSPFAFTGNRFEFRSVGSSLSISGPNTTIDAMVAYTLKQFADELEKAGDFETALADLIKREVTAHWRIIFNGNGYDSSWIEEAKNRGLLNLGSTPDAMEHYLAEKNVKLFTEMGVYTEDEMKSHYEIKLEKYSKMLNIEVNTMLEMISKDILPNVFRYIKDVSQTVINLKSVVPGAKAQAESRLLAKLDSLADRISDETDRLYAVHEEARKAENVTKSARIYADKVVPQMAAVRKIYDEMEPLLGEDYKPFPSYEDLMFRV